MELTILTICHNQVEYLERCVLSIINQQLPFDYEIVLGDDASTDGTWELAQQLSDKYQQIKITRCDTNDYPCSTKSQRSGWNRQNAYKLATGKYITFVDADDYYKDGTSVLMQQYNLLESHPDCIAAMANNYMLHDGSTENTAWFQDNVDYEYGQIISAYEYMCKSQFRCASAFMFRRKESKELPLSVLKGFFSDTITTAYFMQFGDVVCLKNNDSGYVYVQYPKSASHNESWASQDWALWASRCIFIPYLIPYWKHFYLESRRYRASLLATIKRVRKAKEFNVDVVHMFNDFDVWFYKVVRRKRFLKDDIRLFVLEWLVRIPQYISLDFGRCYYDAIWNLLCSENVFSKK